MFNPGGLQRVFDAYYRLLTQVTLKLVIWFWLFDITWSLLWQIDSNTDGLVDFPEFVAATLHVHQLEEHNNVKWQKMSKAAFEKFDVDKDGFITPEELKMVSFLEVKHPTF